MGNHNFLKFPGHPNTRLDFSATSRAKGKHCNKIKNSSPKRKLPDLSVLQIQIFKTLSTLTPHPSLRKTAGGGFFGNQFLLIKHRKCLLQIGYPLGWRLERGGRRGKGGLPYPSPFTVSGGPQTIFGVRKGKRPKQEVCAQTRPQADRVTLRAAALSTHVHPGTVIQTGSSLLSTPPCYERNTPAQRNARSWIC